MIYGIVGGLLAFLILVGVGLALMWRRVVPTNMVHIVQSAKGKIAYGAGRAAGSTYYEIPSQFPRFGVVVTTFQESIFDISLKDYEAYDVGRLPFIVDISAFFRIEDSEVAAQRVANFDELKRQLHQVLQGAVRSILSANSLEHIMQDRTKLGNEFTNEVNQQLNEWGVTTAKMIEFMDIRDSGGSQVIHNMMAKEKSRIEMESRVTVAENNQKAKTKEIEAAREVSLNEAEAQQAVGIRQAEADKATGIAQEQAKQEIQAEAKTTTEREMDVTKVREVRQAEINRDVATVKAEQDQKVAIVTADAEKETTIRIADGKLAATKKNAEGILAIGTSEAEAEKLKQLAPVTAQLTLADGIGSNENYQTYLLNNRKIEATEAVGKEMAGALAKADLKVIANSGSVTGGVGSLGDILSPAGGTSIAGMFEALAQTEQGKKVIDAVTNVAKK